MFNKSFDTKYQELTKSIIDYAYEYVGFDDNNVDSVFVYCSYEENTYNVDYFFKIKGRLIERHKVNFDNLKYNISDEFQLEVIRAIRKDFTSIIELFKSYKRDIPTQIKMFYHPKTGKFNSKIDYNLHWSNTDDLLPEDVADLWFNELKNADERK